MATKLRDRLAGIFALIEYVQLRGSCELPQLAAHFEMDPQQLRDLLTQLSVIDLPHLGWDDLPVVDFDLLDDNQVEFLSVPDIQVFHFSRAEAQALLLGLQLLLPTLTAKQATGAASLQRKLIDYYQLADYSQYLEVVANPRLTQYQQLLGSVAAAEGWVTFSYQNARGEVSRRTFAPQELAVLSGNLLVRGWCQTSGQQRTFRVSRMKDLQQVEFPEDAPEALSVASKRKRYPQVRLVLEQLPESLKEAALQVVETESGVEVTLRVLDPQWFQTQLLLHADLVKACSDETLFALTRAKAQRAVQLYDLFRAKTL
ncbi:MAG: WYL domain-containing protein [Actinomycetaceae bacterium]|nr:WYL domain-containing protein [Actinomycetaceae bacterium]